ncbi:hypothetical protein SprV_0100149300 [Sparganum proliferum]
MKTSMRRLQINPANWGDLALDRHTWRRAVMTDAAIDEATRITAAKAKREDRKSQLCSLLNAYARPPLICPRCRRTFRAPVGLIKHLCSKCSTRTTPPDAPPSTSVLPPTPTINTDRTPEPYYHPPPPSPQHPLRRLLCPPPLHVILTHRQTSTSPPSMPAIGTQSVPVLVATAPSPHASAWSVTCESIAQRLANQCLEHQPTLVVLVPTVHNAPAHSLTPWAYSVICVSTRAELTAVSRTSV